MLPGESSDMSAPGYGRGAAAVHGGAQGGGGGARRGEEVAQQVLRLDPKT